MLSFFFLNCDCAYSSDLSSPPNLKDSISSLVEGEEVKTGPSIMMGETFGLFLLFFGSVFFFFFY